MPHQLGMAKGGEIILTVIYGDEEQSICAPSAAPVNNPAPAQGATIDVGNTVTIFIDDCSVAFLGKFVGPHAPGSLPPL